jgi:hypothetical protein
VLLKTSIAKAGDAAFTLNNALAKFEALDSRHSVFSCTKRIEM